MQIRGTVQRLYRGENGDQFPSAQFLAATAEGFVWTNDYKARFVFPEFDDLGTCTAGNKCEKHASCMAKAFGGYPLVLNRDAEKLIAESKETPKDAPKPRVSGKECFERMEREHLA